MEGFNMNKKKEIRFFGTVICAFGLIVSNAAPASANLTGGSSATGKTFIFQIYTGADTAFWVPAVSGAKAAAKLTGIELEIQYSNADDALQTTQLRAATARKVAGIATSLPNASTGKAICEAQAAGIPVITFNVNGLSKTQAKCVTAFVGQDFVAAGAAIAQRLVDDGLVKRNSKAYCPVEFPTATYALQRHQGVMSVFKKIGATCAMVGVGAAPDKAQTTMVNYLLGKRDVTAIVALGGTPLSVAEAVADKLKKPNMVIGGFDLSKPVLDGIKSGRIVAAVDQQPYSQGFYAVMQLVLRHTYQLYPSDMGTGGRGLVDKSNIDLVSALVPDYR
jgi:simple sugar transport system substrate-binding protein